MASQVITLGIGPGSTIDYFVLTGLYPGLVSLDLGLTEVDQLHTRQVASLAPVRETDTLHARLLSDITPLRSSLALHQRSAVSLE